MEEQVWVLPRQKIRSLIYTTLRRLSFLLLRVGISANEFAELAKGAYVDEATRRFGRNGRPAPMAFVARKTGLSRPAVKRLKGKFEGLEVISRRFCPTVEGQVLSVWFTDTRYLGERGEPIPLPIESDGRSISEIVARVISTDNANQDASDVIAFVRDLVDTGHLGDCGDGTFVPIKRNFSSRDSAAGIAVALDTSIVRVAKTIVHNLDKETKHTWVQRLVTADVGIHSNDLTVVRAALRRKAERFSEEIDDFLIGVTRSPVGDRPTGNGESVKVGIGVFYVEDD